MQRLWIIAVNMSDDEGWRHSEKIVKKRILSTKMCIFPFKFSVRSSKFEVRNLFVRSFVRLFVRSFVRSFVCWLVGWLVGWLVRSFVRSLVRSLVRSFVRSFVRSLACLLCVRCVGAIRTIVFLRPWPLTCVTSGRGWLARASALRRLSVCLYVHWS